MDTESNKIASGKICRLTFLVNFAIVDGIKGQLGPNGVQHEMQ